MQASLRRVRSMSDVDDRSGDFGESPGDTCTGFRLPLSDLSAESVVALIDERLLRMRARAREDSATRAGVFVIDTKLHPDHRRHRIGTELVRIAALHAKAAGCEWMEVDFEEHPRPVLRRRMRF